MKHLLLTTIAAVLLVGCGESQQSPLETQTAESAQTSKPEAKTKDLATFLPGKRIYFKMPIAETETSHYKLLLKFSETETSQTPTPPEMVWQFEKDSTMTTGMVINGEEMLTNDKKSTYKVEGLEVLLIENGKEGSVTFPSAIPKKGDKVIMGDEDFGIPRHPVTITRIVEAIPLIVEEVKSQTSAAKPQTAGAISQTIKAEPPTAKAPDTPLWIAAREGNIEAVKQHIAAGTNVNAKTESGRTPLHFAALEGHKEIAELLMAEGANVNAKDDDLLTPLHQAAGVLHGRESHKEVVELLIANGADVNAKMEFGRTPLHSAASRGHREIAELLIAAGADVNAKNENGKTILASRSVSIPDLLRKHGGIDNSEGKFTELAINGNIDGVKRHLAAGADVNAKDRLGRTPLSAAADMGHKEIVKLLVENGADGKDVPMVNAAVRDHKEIVELLIAAGADVNAKSPNGKSLLDWVEEGEIADLLRKHGGKTGEELKAEGK